MPSFKVLKKAISKLRNALARENATSATVAATAQPAGAPRAWSADRVVAELMVDTRTQLTGFYEDANDFAKNRDGLFVSRQRHLTMPETGSDNTTTRIRAVIYASLGPNVRLNAAQRAGIDELETMLVNYQMFKWGHFEGLDPQKIDPTPKRLHQSLLVMDSEIQDNAQPVSSAVDAADRPYVIVQWLNHNTVTEAKQVTNAEMQAAAASAGYQKVSDVIEAARAAKQAASAVYGRLSLLPPPENDFDSTNEALDVGAAHNADTADAVSVYGRVTEADWARQRAEAAAKQSESINEGASTGAQNEGRDEDDREDVA